MRNEMKSFLNLKKGKEVNTIEEVKKYEMKYDKYK